MLDYNILYEEPDVIDFYVLSVGQNRYIYKGMSDVHDINIARKFTRISAAHRYARQCGRSDYRIIGVKNYNDDERSIQKLFFIKHRKRKSDEDLLAEIREEELAQNS
jgi:hypothetical protein